MTAPPEATPAAIPLRDAALCVDCEVVLDMRILRDKSAATCRDHHWVMLSIWVPAIDEKGTTPND